MEELGGMARALAAIQQRLGARPYAPASLPLQVRAVYCPEAARPSGWKGEAPGGGTCGTPYAPALLYVAAGPVTLVPLVREDRALAGPSGARLAPSSPARRQS